MFSGLPQWTSHVKDLGSTPIPSPELAPPFPFLLFQTYIYIYMYICIFLLGSDFSSQDTWLHLVWVPNFDPGLQKPQLFSGSNSLSSFFVEAAPLKWSKPPKRVPIISFPGSLNN